MSVPFDERARARGLPLWRRDTPAAAKRNPPGLALASPGGTDARRGQALLATKQGGKAHAGETTLGRARGGGGARARTRARGGRRDAVRRTGEGDAARRPRLRAGGL